jgi:hypothetical protein
MDEEVRRDGGDLRTCTGSKRTELARLLGNRCAAQMLRAPSAQHTYVNTVAVRDLLPHRTGSLRLANDPSLLLRRP